MFETHNTFNTYDRLRAHASTFRSNDHITKSINNSYPAAFSSPSNEMGKTFFAISKLLIHFNYFLAWIAIDYHRSGMPMQHSSVTSNGSK